MNFIDALSEAIELVQSRHLSIGAMSLLEPVVTAQLGRQLFRLSGVGIGDEFAQCEIAAEQVHVFERWNLVRHSMGELLRQGALRRLVW